MIKKKITKTVVKLGVYKPETGTVEAVKEVTAYTDSEKMINAEIKKVEKADKQRYIIMSRETITETRCMTTEFFLSHSYVEEQDALETI